MLAFSARGTLRALNASSRFINLSRLALAEIAGDVPPAAVDMVGGVVGAVGLHVEKLNHEGGALHTVGVGLAVLRGASEGEVDLVEAARGGTLEFPLADLGRETIGVGFEQLGQGGFLGVGHL